MPLVEIEDAQLRALQAQYADADNYRKVWGKVLNSKNKLKALELVREEFPDAPIPELDTAKAASEPILSEIAAVRKQFDDYRAEQEKKETERAERDREGAAKNTISAARRRLKADGWDTEGIEKIEAVMQERNIGDYDVAAAYVRSTLPVTPPIINAYDGRELNWFNPGDDAPDHKMLMDNPAKFKSDMVRKYFTDKANGNLAAWAT